MKSAGPLARAVHAGEGHPMQICPLMSYAGNQVPCVREQCALWDKRDEVCGLLGGAIRVQDAVERLHMAINEIKVKF